MRLTSDQMALHQKAIQLSKSYRELETKLIEVLQAIDHSKLYKKLDCPSLFIYATRILKLSEANSYAFISVARAATQFPALQSAISDQSLSVSKANRIVSSLKVDNAMELIEFAIHHTSREIDFEVARRNPKQRPHDQVKPLSDEFVQVSLSISKQTYENLKRAQSLEAQKGNTLSLAETLEAVLSQHLEKHDPVKRAHRAIRKSGGRVKSQRNSNSQLCPSRVPRPIDDKIATTPSRSATTTNKSLQQTAQQPQANGQPLSAAQKHAVIARDGGRCTHLNANGERCDGDRWLDTHHIISRSQGGSNDPENLTTLRSFHHDLAHQLALPIEGQITWLRSPRVRYG